MKKIFQFQILIFVVLLSAVSCKTTKEVGSSKNSDSQRYQVYPVGFYNLENLYYPLSTDSLRDKEFSPTGSNNWTMEKYEKKLTNMSFVLNEMAKDLGGLTAVGVSEIGNRKVLEDLLATDSLKTKGWEIVHYDSPDWRGIDVGLLYDPTRFEYVTSSTHSYPYKYSYEQGVTDSTFRTRDALLVEGKIAGEKVAIMVNHWPSRRGDKSYLARDYAATIFKNLYDSLMRVDPSIHVIMMGDLNDDPTDSSCAEVLNAKRYAKDVEPNGLYNTMWEKYEKGIGTLCYQGKWNLFDQIIVSYNLLGNDYKTLKFYKAEVFNRDFLIQKTGKYKGYPFRTFSGGHFQNGFSDHFPTYIYLVKKKK
ncbi:endonuclease [Paludibacter sp.]